MAGNGPVFLDVDGVLADFVLHLTRCLAAAGRPVPETSQAEVRDWWLRDIMSDEDRALGERLLADAVNWWEGVPPLADGASLRRLAAGHKGVPVVFVTSRRPTRGDPVWRQTVRWLERLGIGEPPVLVATSRGLGRGSDKAALARRWGARAAVEDSPLEARRYAAAGVPVLLVARPYNEGLVGEGIRRLALADALDAIGLPEVDDA